MMKTLVTTIPMPSKQPTERQTDADEALLSQEGERLIILLIKRQTDLAQRLAGWEALDESIPEVDDDLLP